MMQNVKEKLRQLVSGTSIRFVSAPYLPSGLIWTALLLAYTDLAVILLGQPGVYWIDHSRAASSFPVLTSLLNAGILPFALAGLFYLILLWLVLTVLTRSFALVLWMSFSFVHLTHALSWAVGKTGFVNGLAEHQVLIVNAASALILGIVLVVVLIKPKQPTVEPNRHKNWIKLAALAAWLVLLILAVSASASWPRGGWSRLQPEHTPGHRSISAVAYDPARQRIVLFGGISDWLGSKFLYENDTWEWDGVDWVEMKPETIPPARAGHMMAYDEKRGVVVLFGGEDKSGKYMLSDTWEWDGKDWKAMYPGNYPQGRRGGQLFYDHETGKIILAGGFHYELPDKVFTQLYDIWEWDGENWRYLTSAPQNLIITNPNVAYDPLHQRIVLFNYNKVMTWEGGQWKELATGGKFPARYGSWLAADLENGKMLVFGGLENNVQLNDTWLLDGNVWKELHPDLSPAQRDAHVMFYDPIRKSFVLYGGISTLTLDDMWEFVLP